MAATATPKEAKLPAVCMAAAAPEDLAELTAELAAELATEESEPAMPVERLLLDPEGVVAELRVLVT
jgi:hypothetical protein